MAGSDERTVYGVNANLLAILGFVFAVVLVGVSPPLFAVFGAVVVLGVVLATVGDFGTESDGEENAEREDPLEVLQTRYARGEIDEAEFERRLDRILAANEAVGRDAGRDRTGASDTEDVPDVLEEESLEPERENA